MNVKQMVSKCNWGGPATGEITDLPRVTSYKWHQCGVCGLLCTEKRVQ